MLAVSDIPAAIEKRECYCPHCGGPVNWPSMFSTAMFGETPISVVLGPRELVNTAILITCYCGKQFRAVWYAQQRLREARAA